MIRKLRERGLYFFIIAFVGADIALALTAFRTTHENFQNLLFDQYQRWRPRVPVQDRVRIVEIDDESIARLGQWPWPRRTVARLTEALGRAHVAAICFDVLFSEPDRVGFGEEYVQREGVIVANPGDEALANAFAGQAVALGALAKSDGEPSAFSGKAAFALVGDDPSSYLTRARSVLPPVRALADGASGVGFVNWRTDADRMVRVVPLLMAVGDGMIPSLALETLRVAQGASTYIVKSGSSDSGLSFAANYGVAAIKVGDLVVRTQAGAAIRPYFAPPEARRAFPAWKALEKNADLADFDGKIIVVGASASMLADFVATPLAPSTPGVEAEAQVIEQLIDGVSLVRPEWASGAELAAAILVSLGFAITAPMTSALIGAILGAGAVVAMSLTSWLAFIKYGVLFDPVTPSLASGMVFLAAILTLFGQKRQQLAQMQQMFGRFVSSAVVTRLADNPESAQLGGAERTLTLMFCDIRSFTTISEGLSAQELTTFLNEYLTPMTNIVLGQMGTVDKYMGDAIMAFWNAPLDDPRHATHAVAAALKMRATLAQLNRQWEESAAETGRAFRKLRFGIGLNTGLCCVGNLGSTLRFDYSAIGDEVNVASRLEGSSKVFDVDIVASEATRAEAADFAWLEIDNVLLKNKARPVSVFALAGDAAFASTVEFRDLARLHAEMLDAYRGRRFEIARDLANQAFALSPESVAGLYRYSERRYARLAAEQLSPDWRPLIALEEK